MSRKGWNLQASLTSASDHRKWWALSRHQVSTPACRIGGCDPMACVHSMVVSSCFLVFPFVVNFLTCFPRSFSVFPVTSKASSSWSPLPRRRGGPVLRRHFTPTTTQHTCTQRCLRRVWACQERSASPLARAYVWALLPCVSPDPPKERTRRKCRRRKECSASAGFRCTGIF